MNASERSVHAPLAGVNMPEGMFAGVSPRPAYSVRHEMADSVN